MAEMNKGIGTGSGAEKDKTTRVDRKEVNGAGDENHEGEKERNIAKAALSIAELGQLFFL